MLNIFGKKANWFIKIKLEHDRRSNRISPAGLSRYVNTCVFGLVPAQVCYLYTSEYTIHILVSMPNIVGQKYFTHTHS